MQAPATLEPAATASNIDALLIIDHFTRTGWIVTATAMPVLQRPESEAQAAIMRLASAKSGRDAILLPVKGPPGHQDAYRQSVPYASKVPASLEEKGILQAGREGKAGGLCKTRIMTIHRVDV